jgi:hypothetical protein
MRTDGSGNFLRTKQLGKRTVYTSSLPALATTTAAWWTAIAVANFVPPTATQIKVQFGMGNGGSSSGVSVAPNNTAYTAASGSGLAYLVTPTSATYLTELCEMTLESTNIYYGSNTGSGTIVNAYGWTDKMNAN